VNSATQGTIERMATAWRGLAPRERWLLALLTLVGLVAVTVMAADWRDRRAEVHALATADLAARRDIAAAGRRGATSADADQLRIAAARSIRGTDIWMARVDLEQHLSAAVTAAGVATPRIVVAEEAEDGPDAQVLRAEITAPYDGGALVRLLEALSADPRAYFVDSLSVDKGEAPEFRLALSFPVQVTPGAPGA